jgi:hypothetical protein
MARFVGRENVRKRLAPLEGEHGRTSYANGVVRLELPGEAIVVRPPFGSHMSTSTARSGWRRSSRR